MTVALAVADTGAPACITLADAVIAADAKGRAHGLIIGGRRMAEHGLATLQSGLLLLDLATEQAGHRADIAETAAALERQAADLLARLVKLRVENTATPDQRAA